MAEILKTLGLPEFGSDGFDQKAVEQSKVDSYNESVGELDKEDGFNCNRCKNKGMIAELHFYDTYQKWGEVLIQCRCQVARSAIRRLNRSGLKDVVKKYTFDTYQATDSWQQTVKSTAERFCADGSGAWFFIGGQSGAGKTHLCTAIAVKAIKAGMNVRYMLWRDEIARIKAAVTDSEEYGEIMCELKKPDVLYIDDLFKTGKGNDGRTAAPTAADINAAFEIINFRYNNPKAITIISSERTLTELLDIDEAIAGRIAERSKPGGYCINLKRDPSKNYRMNGMIEL